MTTVTPEGTLNPTHEPLKTLMKHRRVDPGKTGRNKACVGVNAVHATSGVVSVGDVVTVTQTGVLNTDGIWNGGDITDRTFMRQFFIPVAISLIIGITIAFYRFK